tara:strand:- start:33959 stop:34324 length:366 start_codon:yes stop_codon:yes gene_type:complete
MTKERIFYARQCCITGEGMNEGYCIGDGEMYVKHEHDFIKHIREVEKEGNPEYDSLVAKGSLTDDFLIQDYYQADYYYWTEWECDEDIQFEEINGKLKCVGDYPEEEYDKITSGEYLLNRG